MIAKLIAWGADRDEAIARMRRALADYRVAGPATTIPFHQLALAHPAFAAGQATVNFIPRYLAANLRQLGDEQHAAGAQPGSIQGAPEPTIGASETVRTFQVEVNGRRFDVRVAETGAPAGKAVPAERDQRRLNGGPRRGGARMAAPMDGVVSSIQGAIMAVKAAAGQAVEAGQVLFIIEAMKMENEITAPHPGTLGEVRVEVGQVVEAGTVLATYQK
jgi:acetyl-CoA/propionyl-CoA carboxylase biotin carboxyl carrier protein